MARFVPTFALELLQYLTIQHGDDPAYNFATTIVEARAQFSELVNSGLDSLPIIKKISP